jgi:hypothetical protein
MDGVSVDSGEGQDSSVDVDRRGSLAEYGVLQVVPPWPRDPRSDAIPVLRSACDATPDEARVRPRLKRALPWFETPPCAAI